MSEYIRREIRLPETISPFGPGAIADIAGDSLVAPDLSRWSTKTAQEIACERLARELGGGHLLSAPIVLGELTPRTPVIPFTRFPAWRFCERCGAITKKTTVHGGKYVNECACRGKLVPMRFVAVCETGSHMQDIDWPTWVHRVRRTDDDTRTEDQRHCRARDTLKLRRLSDAGEGLASIVVTCIACGIRKSMSALGSKTSLSDDGFTCDGTQPWLLRREGTECSALLIPKQRGATSNYLPEVVSAIDIPQGEDPAIELLARIAEHPGIGFVRDMMGSPIIDSLVKQVSEDLRKDGIDVTDSLVLQAAEATGRAADRPIVALKEGEWFAFQKKISTGFDPELSDFVVDGRNRQGGVTDHPTLGAVIDGVGQVRRLRVVRALHGYRRHSPEAKRQPVDIGGYSRTPSFPALELFGEGIFLRFDPDVLAEWEKRPEVQRRGRVLQERLAASYLATQLDEPTPRHIALHTLSHLLLRRLSFTSGYSSASLQERVYSGSPENVDMAGILLYTAAGDAQGTLGGLVRLGDPGLLEPLILGALSDAAVCSNDPVCLESDRQGAAGLNLSACHGCCLVSETSCENRNHLLDRQLLLGGDEVEVGLLAPVLESLHR